ncbi:MAG: glycine--tRNA ligase [Nitrososphaerales archaeon]|nr:glycine--tRNA ligase [Nitrososphaerales archaeon]
MSFEEVMRLAQQKGFFFKAADSYPNSPAGFWDYGPLGVSIRNKFVELWRRMLVRKDGMVEIDGAQILPKAVFEASGHLQGFTDPIVQCSKCGSVFRPDKLIEEKSGKQTPEKLADGDYDKLMEEAGVRCSKCGSKLSGTRRFNMMFRVSVGAGQEEAYLRPETCQSIFVDFPLLFKTQRIKLPIGFAQVGRSFRNEIAPRQGFIRLRELNQAEVEVFFNPKKVDQAKFGAKEETRLNITTPDGRASDLSVKEAVAAGLMPNGLVGYYLALIQDLYLACGIERERIRFRMLSDEDRAFYSKVAYDLEVSTSVGWLELVACNYRSDYDLGRHSAVSGSDFTVDDDGEKVLPHVFELSMGVDRSIYTILETSLRVEGERRTLALRPYLAPQKVGVFPLVNKDGIPELSTRVHASLADDVEAFYDDSGSIGRRYARADEVGVPFCVTVDYDSLKDETVTLRSRDTREQERVRIDELPEKLRRLTSFPPISG